MCLIYVYYISIFNLSPTNVTALLSKVFSTYKLSKHSSIYNYYYCIYIGYTLLFWHAEALFPRSRCCGFMGEAGLMNSWFEFFTEHPSVFCGIEVLSAAWQDGDMSVKVTEWMMAAGWRQPRSVRAALLFNTIIIIFISTGAQTHTCDHKVPLPTEVSPSYLLFFLLLLKYDI